MSDGPSREEFARLYTTIDDGFAGIHERLDVLNGRTSKGEVERENLRTRTVSLEKEVFTEPRRRASDVPAPAPPFFTKREGALITLGVAVISALVKLMLLSGEFVIEFAKAALKGK